MRRGFSPCQWSLAVALFWLLLSVTQGLAEQPAPPAGWSTFTPREEIRPQFRFERGGGPGQSDCFVIEADQRPGLMGRWTKTFPVEGGRYYRFHVLRRASGVAQPRRTAVARLLWRNEKGRPVLRDKVSYASYRPGERPRAEPEFPPDRQAGPDGWTEVSAIYRAPSEATRAIVELNYRWVPGGKVQWAAFSLAPTAPPAPRKVRLATVHFRPKEGKTPAEKCRLFAPLIEAAAKQKADLVVLPECLTYYRTGKVYVDCAEPVPGPSTEYFGTLAKKHDLLHCRRLDRARRLPRVQRGCTHRARRKGRGQVPQGDSTARRNRRWRHAR